MSITFSTSNHTCDCARRWIIDGEAIGPDVSEWPEPYTCHVCTELEMNLANENAYELMRWLDITADLYSDDFHGEIKAKELAARCRRRLWDEPRNHDAGVDGYEQKEPGKARLIYGGRRPGYLREMVEKLLKIAEAAGEDYVMWS